MSEPKATPLYDKHVKYKGRIVDFAGWLLPVQYSGIVDEHMAVRQAAGLFDVSHMGEIKISGAQALDLLQKLVSNDVSRLKNNQIQYTHMLYPNGGVVDDLLISRLGQKEFFLVVNASNAAKDLAWITEAAIDFPEAQVTDLSEQTGELALQGPHAAAILQQITRFDLSQLKYFWCRRGVRIGRATCLVSRTGYTGEDGFEIFCLPEDAPGLWELIMDAGSGHGLKPVGLGARDSLRFEASMPLYGHELDSETTPIEAGLSRFVRVDKGDFTGREVLARQLSEGVEKTLVGFEMVDRGVPRTGYAIKSEGNDIGQVTSGSFAPVLEKNLGLGYVPPGFSEPGTEIEVDIRGRGVRAQIVPFPFYRRNK